MTRRGFFATIAAAFAWRKPKPNLDFVQPGAWGKTRLAPVDFYELPKNSGLYGLKYYNVAGNCGLYMGVERASAYHGPFDSTILGDDPR